MRLSRFTFVAGRVGNDPDATTPGGGASGTVTLTGNGAQMGGGFMTAEGSTMTINDGSSTRTITLTFGTTDDRSFRVDSMASNEDFRQRLTAAINGSDGGAIGVTAVDPGSGDAITLTHDSGGSAKMSISFGGESTSTTSMVESGVTYITVSPSNATQPISPGVSKASDFITGSQAITDLLPSTPFRGKITLRQKSGAKGSLSSFAVSVNENDTSFSDGKLHVTGSLSGNSDPTYVESKAVRGDFLFVTSDD